MYLFSLFLAVDVAATTSEQTSSLSQVSIGEFGASELKSENPLLRVSYDDQQGTIEVSGRVGYTLYAPISEKGPSSPVYARFEGSVLMKQGNSEIRGDDLSFYPEVGYSEWRGPVQVLVSMQKTIITIYCYNGTLYVNGASKGRRTASNPYVVGDLAFWCEGNGDSLRSRHYQVP
jgi:hypothetical protein